MFIQYFKKVVVNALLISFAMDLRTQYIKQSVSRILVYVVPVVAAPRQGATIADRSSLTSCGDRKYF
jgi:hypothetical protein